MRRLMLIAAVLVTAAILPTRAHAQQSVMSWYDDAGQTASGLHYTYGFAACGYGDCVPMGTKIKFCLHGCVIGQRDDSGPYIAGRAFDLNQNIAAAIGLQAAGVAAVHWQIMTAAAHHHHKPWLTAGLGPLPSYGRVFSSRGLQ
jgi:hypothetical protein